MSENSISDLMHDCVSVTICPATSLRQAAECVLRNGLDSLPVVTEEGRFAGLVAQAALVRQLLSSGSDDDVVAPIVSRHIESARSTASIDSVLPMFRSTSVTVVPVVDDQDRPVGLVHREDIIRYLLSDRVDTTNSSQRIAGRPHYLDGTRIRSDRPIDDRC